MTQRKETLRNLLNLLIIACVIILFGFLGGFISGMLSLSDTAGIFLQYAVLVLLISLGMKLISQYHKKPLTKGIEDEGITESEQKDEKQSLFKPSIGVSVIFMFFIAMPVISIISQFTNKKDDLGLTIAITGVGIFFTWMWYKTPVFIFADNAVQIKSHLFYLLGIDRKTVISYTDITSVNPDPDAEGGAVWGVEPKHRMLITSNGTTQNYGLAFYNSNIVDKIYLRFKEKLGDKVID